jgi:hypothetical protein
VTELAGLERGTVRQEEGPDKGKRIPLADTIEGLRDQLGEAMAKAAGQGIQFPVGPIQLEFQIGVTKEGEGKAGVRFWVLELGGGGSYANESVQKVTVSLEPPVTADGDRVLVHRGFDKKP